MPILVNLVLEDKEVAYLLCSAIEGGIQYWSKEVTHRYRRGVERAKPWGDTYTPDYISAPFTEGGSITLVHDAENDREGAASQETKIDRAVLQKGLTVMAQQYPNAFADFIAGKGDAETGDVFMQCCIFGKIIFG